MIPYGYVYEIRNLINNKTYIGQRKLSLDKYWRQYMGSGILLPNAFEKYGKNNFVKSLVQYAYSIEELIEIEMYYIKKQKALGKAEYNVATHVPSSSTKHFRRYQNLDKSFLEIKLNFIQLKLNKIDCLDVDKLILNMGN